MKIPIVILVTVLNKLVDKEVYIVEAILLEKYGPFMDLEELAVLLKIKKQSLYQQIYREGLDIPHVKRGKKYLFPTQEVAKYFTSQLSLPVGD